MNLKPAVRTSITGEGSVVWHDETRHGLRRLCVQAQGKYPDLDVWVGLLPKNADVRSYRYTEREFSYFLWIFWKEKP